MRLSAATRIFLLLIIFLFFGGSFSAETGEALILAGNARAEANIVVSVDASSQVKSAAEILSDYAARASGIILPVVVSGEAFELKGINVFVGKKAVPPEEHELIEKLEKLDEDGFIIDASGSRIIISGGTDWGTEFGVYEFLERFLGVRWLMPGECGTDIPRTDSITVPNVFIEEEPVFFSRHLSGLRGHHIRLPSGERNWQQFEWARANKYRADTSVHPRYHGRIQFHHNMGQLFPPEEYFESHPRFYGVRGGKQVEPSGHRWQPCFSAEGLVDEAVRNILVYFERNPGHSSYSLGINDSTAFCQCDDCLSRITGEENYRGFTDYSDLYYAWANEVVEKVLEHHPDKWFGCLAYRNVAGAPQNIRLHPRLVPYNTMDRMMWVDKEREKTGHEVTKEWKKKAEVLGWYDYVYGQSYAVPRVYMRHMADYLRFGADNGVSAYYAEAHTNWGEGPKLYVLLKLLWDPYLDVDELLSEWYERAVGQDAAPHLAGYYDIWEQFWTEAILDSEWFPAGMRTWLPFASPRYLASVEPGQISESRRLLEKVVEKAETEKQAERANLIMRAFEYYEASVIAYRGHMRNIKSPETEEDALALIEDTLKIMEAAHRRRYIALERSAEDPHLVQASVLERLPELSGESWGAAGLWVIGEFLRKGNKPVIKRMNELKEHELDNVRINAERVINAYMN